jgi:hypothetical protein
VSFPIGSPATDRANPVPAFVTSLPTSRQQTDIIARAEQPIEQSARRAHGDGESTAGGQAVRHARNG